MTKFLWSRRLYSCLLCCGQCPHLGHHSQYQKNGSLKGKRDHHYHHSHHYRGGSGGGGGHIWRKTVVFGIFVFTLYFALLSFVSFLAVSNHRMVISAPNSARGAPSAMNHVHGVKNGSTVVDAISEGFGERSPDKTHHHRAGVGGDHEKRTGLQNEGTALQPSGGGSENAAATSRIQRDGNSNGGGQTNDKVGGNQQLSVHSRRDASYMNDLMRSRAIFKCVPVHYREKPGSVVALASFPGSGNTWLRYLLQLSTGVFTGSVYKDFALLRNGFPAESVTNGRVLVVKTHESGQDARSLFEKAILLVRKPSEAILAEFNRRAAGHIGHAGRDKYTRNAGRYWSQFVAQKAKSWTETNLDWIEHFSGPLLITMYHQLVHNTSHELTTILDFLQEPVSDSVMNCVLNNKEGIYRRRKKYSQFNPFTPQMEKFLAAQEKIVYNAIQRRVAKETAKVILIYNSTSAQNNKEQQRLLMPVSQHKKFT